MLRHAVLNVGTAANIAVASLAVCNSVYATSHPVIHHHILVLQLISPTANSAWSRCGLALRRSNTHHPRRSVGWPQTGWRELGLCRPSQCPFLRATATLEICQRTLNTAFAHRLRLGICACWRWGRLDGVSTCLVCPTLAGCVQPYGPPWGGRIRHDQSGDDQAIPLSAGCACVRFMRILD
jgi:hypothetical protein